MQNGRRLTRVEFNMQEFVLSFIRCAIFCVFVLPFTHKVNEWIANGWVGARRASLVTTCLATLGLLMNISLDRLARALGNNMVDKCVGVHVSLFWPASAGRNTHSHTHTAATWYNINHLWLPPTWHLHVCRRVWINAKISLRATCAVHCLLLFFFINIYLDGALIWPRR